MTLLIRRLAVLVSQPEMRANIGELLRYLAFLVVLITVYAGLFHFIMLRFEGQEHSWITGFYWALVVMTTLGFGDVTFASDVGRVFSLVVLLSGVVFLLVMLPFLFIRLFYTPWIEARVRILAPREAPPKAAGHVIITEYDAIAVGLVQRLAAEGVPCFTIEPDPVKAARLLGDGVPVVAGKIDERATYERLRADAAGLVFANGTDTANTNVTLTVREVAAGTPIVATAENEDSVDILELSGASTVLPLKKQLGEYMASRVDAGRAEAHVVGAIHDLQIAELPARDTSFAGMKVRETHLRERIGLTVAGLWERGRLRPAYPDTLIDPGSVLVLTGTAAHIAALTGLLPGRTDLTLPVLVIGAGAVGRAAVAALHRKGFIVHVIDRDEAVLAQLADHAHEVFAGDAANRQLIERAGVGRAGSVLLTSNDDAVNIYLAVYCRRLNPDVRIVSRIARNEEAIHRAGADFVLSDATIGVEAVMSLLDGHEPVLLGEGVRLFTVGVPAALAGRPLRDSGIGSQTGMSVIAVRRGEEYISTLTGETILPPDGELLMLGSLHQRRSFGAAFDTHRPQ